MLERKKSKVSNVKKRDRKARNQGLSVGDSAQRCALCRNDVSHTGETGGKQMGGSHIIGHGTFSPPPICFPPLTNTMARVIPPPTSGGGGTSSSPAHAM